MSTAQVPLIETLDKSYNSFFYASDSELWISSQTGWTRYDGEMYNHYVLEHPTSGLQGTWIQSTMVPDVSGTLWTSTYEYLCHYDREDDFFYCRQVVVRGDTIKNEIRVIDYSMDDQTLLIQAGPALYHYDSSQNKYTEVGEDSSTDGVVHYMYKHDGIHHILSSPYIKGQVLELRTRHENHWSKKAIDFSSCTGELATIQVSQMNQYEGDMWLATNIGLVRLDRENPCNSQVYNSSDQPTGMPSMVEMDGHFILSTQLHGLLIFDITKRVFTHQITESHSTIPLLTDHTIDLFQSSTDVYVSHRANGLQRLSASTLRALLYLPRLADHRNQSYALGKSDCIVTTDKMSYIDVYTKELEFIAKIPLDGKTPVSDIYLTDQTIYYADYHTIWRYDLVSKTTSKVFEDKSLKVSQLILHEGELYIVASLQLYSISDGHLERITNEQYAYENIIRYIRIGDTVDIASTATAIHIVGDSVRTIKTDGYVYEMSHGSSDSIVLIATGNGLMVLQLPHLEYDIVPTISESINHISEGDNGEFYLTGETGIFRYSQDSESSIVFSNESVVSCAVAEGWLLVTTEDGVHLLESENMMKHAFDSIYIAGSTYPIEGSKNGDVVRYQYNESPMTIDVKSTSIAGNEYGQYSYRLSSHEKPYGPFDLSQDIQLPPFQEGTYQLTIQGYNSKLAPTNTLDITLHIQGPFWRQWWFLLCTGLLLALLMWLYFGQRQKRLLEKMKIAKEINHLEKAALQAQMNPHFIFNCLNSIQSFIMDNDKEQAMDYLTSFAQLIRANLNASIATHITLAEEIQILENYLKLEQLRLDGRFQFSITPPADVDPYDIKLPPMLIQPFVENAVIHGMRAVTKDGQIHITCSLKGDQLSVEVTDSGLKTHKAKPRSSHKSVGVDITKKRLAHINKSLGKTLHVSTTTHSQGTTVYLTIAVSGL